MTEKTLYCKMRGAKRMSIVTTTGFISEGDDIIFLVSNGPNLRMESVRNEEFEYIATSFMDEDCPMLRIFSKEMTVADDKNCNSPKTCESFPSYAIDRDGCFCQLSPEDVFESNAVSLTSFFK